MHPPEDSYSTAAAHPGYVRLVLPADRAHARAACRRFSRLCEKESARGGLILARSPACDPEQLEGQMALATQAMPSGFRLALVAQGANAAHLRRIASATAARRRARWKAFLSEHRAAAWLMG